MTVTATSADTAEGLDRGDGRQLRLLVDAAATDQRLSALLCVVPAGSSGPPLHTHPGTDELFLVEEGTLLLHAAGVTHRLGRGGAGFVPRGTPHTFAAEPDGPVRFWTVHVPGGFEEMHRKIAGAERRTGRALSAEEIAPIAARYDWTFAGPPLLPTGQLAGPPPSAVPMARVPDRPQE